ncbi:MAG TPA: hypothetical protein VM901_04420 [Bdellovibrionota bacterium]|jgi:hypothetical protein|nr:hypothetical protein [Bdellovibrionota bacterium]
MPRYLGFMLTLVWPLCANAKVKDCPSLWRKVEEHLYSQFSFLGTGSRHQLLPEHKVKAIRDNLAYYFTNPEDVAAATDFFASGGVLSEIPEGAYFTYDDVGERPLVAMDPARIAALSEQKFSLGLMDAVSTFRHELRHYQDWKAKKAELEAKGVEDAAEKAQEFYSTGRGRELTEKNAVASGYRALKDLIVKKEGYKDWLVKETEGKMVFPDDAGVNHFATQFLLGSSTYPESEGLRLELHQTDEAGFKLEMAVADKRSAWIEMEKNKEISRELVKAREEEFHAAEQAFATFKLEHQGRMRDLMKEAVLKTLSFKKAFHAYYRRAKAENKLSPESLKRLERIYEYLNTTSNLNLLTSGSGAANLIMSLSAPQSRFREAHIRRLQRTYDEVMAELAQDRHGVRYRDYFERMPEL